MRELLITKKSKVNPALWLDLYSDYLFSYALSRVHNKEVAEDMVQDTFLSAIKSKNSFQQKSTERTWLTSILKNKIIDYYKKKSTQKEVEPRNRALPNSRTLDVKSLDADAVSSASPASPGSEGNRILFGPTSATTWSIRYRLFKIWTSA